MRFCTAEAIQRTEAYEYAQSLGSHSLAMPNFQVSLTHRNTHTHTHDESPCIVCLHSRSLCSDRCLSLSTPAGWQKLDFVLRLFITVRSSRAQCCVRPTIIQSCSSVSSYRSYAHTLLMHSHRLALTETLTHTHTDLHSQTDTHTYTHTQIHTGTCSLTHTHALTYTCIHTHTHTLLLGW